MPHKGMPLSKPRDFVPSLGILQGKPATLAQYYCVTAFGSVSLGDWYVRSPSRSP